MSCFLVPSLKNMYKNIPTILIVFLVLIFVPNTLTTNAQTSSSQIADENIVIRSLLTIHGAQMTYASTYGNGNYATTLEALRHAELIDPILASGYKYGYTFAMFTTLASTTTPATFVVTATPQHYPETGRRSFFIDTSGEIRGGDKKGRVATASDPYIDSCSRGDFADNETCTMRAIRTLHGAEMTYSSTHGNGNYGSIRQLGAIGLINRSLATGMVHGYSFTVTFVDATQTVPAWFKISAVPQIYGRTGVRSFFMDTSGVFRGGDKQGKPATENDPLIETCTNGSIAENELCTINSLRMLHGAEMTYWSTYGNGSFTSSLAELASVGLIEEGLGSGQLRGYSFYAVAFPQTLNAPASFKINATPLRYGVSGIRSFFIDTSGVILGADKHGEPADENDPPITY